MTFEINNNKPKKYYINNYEFTVIKDFYKYPDQVVKLFKSIKPKWHKSEGGYFHQGIDFKDKRHILFSNELKPLYELFENMFKQKTHNSCEEYSKYLARTNYTKFLNNNWKDYYFYPHKDNGVTILIYLNKKTSNGTNFYIPNKKFKQGKEHKEHFYPKNQLKLIHHIKSEYNKLIAFEGDKLYHGLCMDKKYLNKWRLNQAFFLAQKQEIF